MVNGQAVIIENILYYYGEAVPNFNYGTSLYQIYCYRIHDRKWLSTTIKHPPIREFSIGKVLRVLVSIGGHNQTGLYGTLRFYNQNIGKWIDNNTPMPTPRAQPTVISQPTCLIAAGGGIHSDLSNWVFTNIVEIFSTSTSQWSKVDSLPIACACQTGGVSNGMVYLIGGISTNRLGKSFVAPLDKLLSRTSNTPNQDPSTQSEDKSSWSEAADTPTYNPSALVMSDMVIAVGGAVSADTSKKQRVKDVHAYSPSMNAWIRVGELPVALTGACVVAISPVEFLVINGVEDGAIQAIKTVYKGVAKLGFN